MAKQTNRLTEELLLELKVKGYPEVEKALRKYAKDLKEVTDNAKKDEKVNKAHARQLNKYKELLKGMGISLKKIGIAHKEQASALKGNTIIYDRIISKIKEKIKMEKAHAAAIKEDAIRAEKKRIQELKRAEAVEQKRIATNIKRQKTLKDMKFKLRHYGVSVKQVAHWEKLRTQVLKGNKQAQAILNQEINKSIIAHQNASKSIRDHIFGVRNLRNDTGGLSMAFSVFRSKLLLATFAMNMLRNTLGRLMEMSEEQERAERQAARAITSTGFAAGMTLTEIKKLASEMQNTSGIADGVAIKMSAVMLTFTNIGREVFPRAMRAAEDLSNAFGQDLKQSVIQVGKALNDPVKGVSALRRVGVSFGATQIQMIKNFVESNDLMSAQTVILKELEKQVGGVSEELAKTPMGKLNIVKEAYGDFAEVLGKGITTLGVPIVTKALEGALIPFQSFVNFLQKGRKEAEAFEQRQEGIKLSLDKMKDSIVDLGGEARKSGFFDEIMNQLIVLKEIAPTVERDEEEFKKFQKRLEVLTLRFSEAKKKYKEHTDETKAQSKAKAELEDKTNKLIESYRHELKLLSITDEFEKAKIKAAKNLGIAVEDLNVELVKELKTLEDKKKTLKEINELEIKNGEIRRISTGLYEDGVKTVKSTRDSEKQLSDERKFSIAKFTQDSQRFFDSKKEEMQLISQVGSQFIASQDAQITAIQGKAQAELASLRATNKFKNASDKQKLVMENQIRKKHNEEILKEFRIKKNMQRGLAVMSGARAFVEALPNYFLAGLTAISTAMQLKAIDSQPRPQAFAKGGDFITSGAENIIVGEAGERVTITPLDRPESRALGSMGGVTVNFTGNVLTQDFIEDEAIPMIKEAVRRGADLGVA